DTPTEQHHSGFSALIHSATDLVKKAFHISSSTPEATTPSSTSDGVTASSTTSDSSHSEVAATPATDASHTEVTAVVPTAAVVPA
ncbi:hypothetical protein ABTA44_20270, partial [Acinetobacter baumannii]